MSNANKSFEQAISGTAMMEVRMRVNDSQPGWLKRVLESGCKATCRPVAFGRTEWLIKRDGEAICILQGKNTGLTTKIDNPSEKQREIAMVLASVGIASVC